MRRLYLALGYASLFLGILGIVLPVLPTTPFVILAAWSFSRSSPALAQRLYEDPRFGPSLRLWRDERAIAPRAKVMAVSAIAASYAVTAFLLASPAAAVGLGLVMGGVALYIATRPGPRGRHLPAEPDERRNET